MATALTYITTDGLRDSSGNPLAGGFLRFVSPSDPNTKVNVFKDAEATLAWAQPITLDGAGRAGGVIYLAAPCQLLVSDKNNANLFTISYPDHVPAACIEVQNSGWTGTSGASTLAGARTWLDSVLTKIKTSLGGTDAKHKDGVGGTERSYYEVIGEFGISPKSYGARWDGQKDDTAAIAATIAVIKARGGGRIILPPGIANVSDALTVDFAGLEVIGAGSSVIRSTVNNKNIFTVSSTRFQISGATLGVATSVGGNSTGYGVAFASGADLGVIDKCSIGRSSDSYFFARGVHTINCDNMLIRDNELYATTFALRFDTATNSNCRIQGNYGKVTDNDTSVIYLGALAYSSVTGNVLYNAGAGTPLSFDIQACARVMFTGNNVITAGNLQISGDSTHIYTENNHWYGLIYTPGANSNTNRLRDAEWGDSTGGRYYSSAVTATAALTLPKAGAYDQYLIGDGGVAITSIVTTGWPAGSVVTLFFNHAATGAGVTDGSNLNIAGSFGYTANDTITLFFDGTNWNEMSRSVN